jgi:hypothetical protein
VYRGHRGIRRSYADASDPWDRLLPEPEEIIEHGGLFVIVVHATAHGHESGVDVDAHIVHVARIEGARLASPEAIPPNATRAVRSAREAACPLATPYERPGSSRGARTAKGRLNPWAASRRRACRAREACAAGLATCLRRSAVASRGAGSSR